jgi:hypothetical protein
MIKSGHAQLGFGQIFFMLDVLQGKSPSLEKISTEKD